MFEKEEGTLADQDAVWVPWGKNQEGVPEVSDLPEKRTN